MEKIRVTEITATRGIEYRFSFVGNGVGGCGHQFLRLLSIFRMLYIFPLLEDMLAFFSRLKTIRVTSTITTAANVRETSRTRLDRDWLGVNVGDA